MKKKARKKQGKEENRKKGGWEKGKWRRMGEKERGKDCEKVRPKVLNQIYKKEII